MRKRVLTLLSAITLGAVVWTGAGVPFPSTWKTPKLGNWTILVWGIEAEPTGGNGADVTFIRAINGKEKPSFGTTDVTGEKLMTAAEVKMGPKWRVRVDNGRSEYRRVEWPRDKWLRAFIVSSTTAPGGSGGGG